MVKCRDCGLKYEEHGLDIVLPLAQWMSICEVGEDDYDKRDIILCGRCIAIRAKKVPGCTVIHAVLEIALPRK